MTALATTAQPLWPLLTAYGHDATAVFRKAGIDPAVAIKDPNMRVSTKAVAALWSEASRLIDDPTFGVKFGLHWQPSMFGPLGYAWLASTTLRKALERFARYYDLAMEKGSVTVEDLSDGNVRITFSYGGEAYTIPPAADALLSLAVRLCRLKCGEDLQPIKVTFFHPPPSNTGAYFKYFRCPVEFDSDRDSIILARATVDEELPSGNPYLANLNEQETIRILAQLDKSKIIDRVKAVIIAELTSGEVSIETVASQVHVSTRTLNRQLQQEGTTFREIYDTARQDLARAYLSDRSLSLTQIAFMLGFSEQGSFTRAYKRWTGKAPSEARG